MMFKLLVLRSPNPALLVQFYSTLGLDFDHHQHGNGPMHYAAQLAEMVLEIYPLANGQNAADPHLRLGLEVADFEQVMERMAQQNVRILQAPQQTEFGYLSIVEDSDGRKVEIYRSDNPLLH